MNRTYIHSELLLESGAVNAVSLRVEDKPQLFSMKTNGVLDGGEAENRREFFASLGFDESSVVRCNQVHGDGIRIADSAVTFPATDALLTRSRNLLLAISVADCAPVLIFDRRQHIVAAVHSGWKGTSKNIAGKTAEFMQNELNSNPEDVVAFIGPSAGACCYEVGEEVAGHFRSEYKKAASKPGKFMLDLKQAIASQLVERKIPASNIEVSDRCTICDLNFHSFRRDGESSGRMLGVVAIK
ncbi:MAG: peptidoglycan editing factor PgeF [Bacteroidetes bacterium]|nr:peptidoglycan editing factor PgeF [Bacteroidota bacterium]